MVFNLAFFVWAVCAMRFHWQREQRFNIYLIAYGAFRFAHEFMRDDVRWFSSFGGYHVVSLAIIGTGVWMYLQRAHIQRESTTAPA
jgi:prolipoprotein diacylglyceryltransferase